MPHACYLLSWARPSEGVCGAVRALPQVHARPGDQLARLSMVL
jgi:hypothetical protein